MINKRHSLKFLGITMLLASIYDWILAVSLLLLSNLILLGIPEELTYFLSGATPMLFLLPLFYMLSYIQTERNIGVISVSIIVRFIGFLLTTLSSLLLGGLIILAILGFIDLLFAILHYYFLKKSEYTFIGALLGRE